MTTYKLLKILFKKFLGLFVFEDLKRKKYKNRWKRSFEEKEGITYDKRHDSLHPNTYLICITSNTRSLAPASSLIHVSTLKNGSILRPFLTILLKYLIE